jgi:hypothetical protein
MPRLLVLAALLFALPAQAEVGIEWVTVGDPGNACETQAQGCFGSVAYEYRISKYEITVSQYTEFLNSVAASDPNGLYNTGMVEYFHSPGITRSGSSGSFTYSMAAGREDRPLNFVSFYSALRFANWLHNGQPTGIQDDSTTEDGAYTMIAEDFEQNPQSKLRAILEPHSSSRARTSGTRRHTTIRARRATSTTRRVRTRKQRAQRPVPRRTRRTVTGLPGISRMSAVTRTRRAQTARSTRAEAPWSGTRRSRTALKMVGVASGAVISWVLHPDSRRLGGTTGEAHHRSNSSPSDFALRVPFPRSRMASQPSAHSACSPLLPACSDSVSTGGVGSSTAGSLAAAVS